LIAIADRDVAKAASAEAPISLTRVTVSLATGISGSLSWGLTSCARQTSPEACAPPRAAVHSKDRLTALACRFPQPINPVIDPARPSGFMCANPQNTASDAMNTEMTVTDWPAPAVGAKRSFLSEDLEINGDVRSAGPVEVMGKITGTVRASDVHIAVTGQVVGQVAALNLSVQGAVEGKIVAKSVTLAASARVQADVIHELITIETGARFEGTLKRTA
jgi:cytoskeletal protein CcmA (bactofilin family)